MCHQKAVEYTTSMDERKDSVVQKINRERERALFFFRDSNSRCHLQQSSRLLGDKKRRNEEAREREGKACSWCPIISSDTVQTCKAGEDCEEKCDGFVLVLLLASFPFVLFVQMPTEVEYSTRLYFMCTTMKTLALCGTEPPT